MNINEIEISAASHTDEITLGTLCSGIGSPELAFQRQGVQTRWQSEIDRDASGVLARQFPDVMNLGDIRNVGQHNAAPVTIICGGTPCQNFSIAGKRAGLAGEQSSLFYEYTRVIRELRPAFAIWENVPGALSSNAGRDFAAVISAFQECGAMDIAYRILDAQYSGVPQRRRRVFIVADFRGERAGKILFEPQSVSGYRPTSRKTGTDIAFTLTGSNQRLDASNNETFIGVTALDARNGYHSDRITSTLQDGTTLNSMPLLAGTLRASRSGLQYASTNIPGDYLVPDGYRVRRLIPRECERLMGFPDDFTRWDASGRELSDSARYRLCGNSIVVPVMEWIARRMVKVLQGERL